MPDLHQFITFRLHDALPGLVLERIRTEVQAMKAKQPPSQLDLAQEQRKRIEAFLDSGHGACHLKNPEIAQIVEDAVLHFNGVRYQIIAWVIMPNHVHILIKTVDGYPLEKIVHSWKSFTAKEVNKRLQRMGRFWQREYFDRYIRDDRHLAAVVKYIEENPVKAGLANGAEAWGFSSAHRRR